MKLRTKLTAFSILLIVTAVAISCALILSFVQTGDMQDVTEAGLTDYQSFYNSFLQSVSTDLPTKAIVKRSFLVDAVRSIDGFREFSLRQGDEYICNNAGFDMESLFQNNAYDSTGGDIDIQYRIVRVAGADYFVAHAVIPIGAEKYDLSFARDISAITDEIRTLALKCATVGLAVTAAAVIAMWMLVHRSLKPIDGLKGGAEELAKGNYGNRIPIKGKDEFSELAADFNCMADAVEANVDALHEKTVRQQAFINDLSHEMKTPVTSILLCAETLLGRNVSTETRSRLLARIYDQGKWLETLSQKLMTLAMLQGELAMRPESVVKLLNAVRETTAAALHERGIALTTECGVDILRMDFDLMRSALTNLVMNAAKASGDGQTVEIRAQGRAIDVIDRGKGIPSGEIARVTEPFYRVDRSRSKKYGGAGLGLALVKRIVEAHGARLTITSVLGAGTTVRIEFEQEGGE